MPVIFSQKKSGNLTWHTILQNLAFSLISANYLKLNSSISGWVCQSQSSSLRLNIVYTQVH